MALTKQDDTKLLQQLISGFTSSVSRKRSQQGILKVKTMNLIIWLIQTLKK